MHKAQSQLHAPGSSSSPTFRVSEHPAAWTDGEDAMLLVVQRAVAGRTREGGKHAAEVATVGKQKLSVAL